MSVTLQHVFDTATVGAISITLTETGGGGATGAASVASGRYTHTETLTAVSVIEDDGSTGTADLDALALTTAIKAALDAVGNATYTVAINASGFYTITAAGGGVTSVRLDFGAVAQRVFGFGATVSGALTHTGTARPYYYALGDIGGVTDLREPYETQDDLAVDLVANDGTVEGLAHPGAAQRIDFTLPYEPRARLRKRDASASVPYTWDLFFRNARNVMPIVLTLDGVKTVCRLRADACAFVPEQLGEEYTAYAGVPFRCYYVGHL